MSCLGHRARESLVTILVRSSVLHSVPGLSTAARRCLPAMGLTAILTGCAGWPRAEQKVPFVIEPPSPEEIAGCALAAAEGPLSQGTYSDRYGNTYAVAAHGGLDQTLVETIESPRGGPDMRGISDSPGDARVSPAESFTAADPGAPEPAKSEISGPSLRLQWPLPATGVTSLFGARRDPLTQKSRFHYGVDMQGEYGQVVKASAAGRVIFAGWNGGHGRQVVIEHSGGWRTSYSHLAQQTVSAGQVVWSGQSIGQLGNSGRSTGPHLHFEVTRWGSYFDPLDILGSAVAID